MIRAATVKFVLFAVATVALTGFIAAQIADVSLGERYTLTARFADVTGVRVGDAVRVAGVPVGNVRGIAVDDGMAVLTFDVDAAVALPDDTEVAIAWLDLIGQKQLDLYPGEATTFLAPGDEVERTRSTVDIGALTAQLGPFARVVSPEDVNALLESVFLVLQDNESDLVGLSGDIRALLDTIASRDTTIDAMVADYAEVISTLAAREQQIRTMVDNLVLVSGAFVEADAVLATALDDGAQVSQQLAAFLDTNAEDLAALIADINDIVAVVSTRTEDIDAIFGDLPGALQQLFEITRHGEYLRVNAVCASFAEPPCEFDHQGSTRGPAATDVLRDLLLGGAG